MAKHHRKDRKARFRGGHLSSEQLDSMLERLRGDLYGRRDPISKRGKTIHIHPVFGEAARNFTNDEIFQTMLTAAKGGDIQRQFLVGLEFAKRGETNSAIYWLKKAASMNWPGAKEAYAQLLQHGRVEEETKIHRSDSLGWKETKICPKCGKRRLNRDFNYCPMCGLQLPQEADEL